MTEYSDEKQNLEILAEEAAEVVRIKSKCIRFGLDDFHPKNGEVNRISLAREIGHFQFMVGLLTDNGTIAQEEIDTGFDEKKESLKKWYR